MVLALDRFGDYVSDQVSAPVRETAAQVLAALLPAMHESSVVRVQHILVDMIDQNGAPPSRGLDQKADQTSTANKSAIKYVWQVRHSGFLGLKHLVAIRPNVLQASPATISYDDVKPFEADEKVYLKQTVNAAILG